MGVNGEEAAIFLLVGEENEYGTRGFCMKREREREERWIKREVWVVSGQEEGM